MVARKILENWLYWIVIDAISIALRPDLSATADIVVESRSNAVSVPIIALTVRDADDVEGSEGGEADGSDPVDVEGVFLVSDGVVSFARIEVGVAGQEYFEVLSGLSAGDVVVAGPYQRIRQLRDGDAISVIDDDEPTEDEGS